MTREPSAQRSYAAAPGPTDVASCLHVCTTSSHVWLRHRGPDRHHAQQALLRQVRACEQHARRRTCSQNGCVWLLMVSLIPPTTPASPWLRVLTGLLTLTRVHNRLCAAPSSAHRPRTSLAHSSPRHRSAHSPNPHTRPRSPLTDACAKAARARTLQGSLHFTAGI